MSSRRLMCLVMLLVGCGNPEDAWVTPKPKPVEETVSTMYRWTRWKYACHEVWCPKPLGAPMATTFATYGGTCVCVEDAECVKDMLATYPDDPDVNAFTIGCASQPYFLRVASHPPL